MPPAVLRFSAGTLRCVAEQDHTPVALTVQLKMSSATLLDRPSSTSHALTTLVRAGPLAAWCLVQLSTTQRAWLLPSRPATSPVPGTMRSWQCQRGMAPSCRPWSLLMTQCLGAWQPGIPQPTHCMQQQLLGSRPAKPSTQHSSSPSTARQVLAAVTGCRQALSHPHLLLLLPKHRPRRAACLWLCKQTSKRTTTTIPQRVPPAGRWCVCRSEQTGACCRGRSGAGSRSSARVGFPSTTQVCL